MERNTMIVTVAAVVIGGTVATLAMQDRSASAAGRDEVLARFESQLSGLSGSMEGLRRDMGQVGVAQDRLELSLATLRDRTAQLEQGAARVSGGSEADDLVPAALEASASDATLGADDPELKAEFAELLAMGALDDYASQLTPEEQVRFWELARSTGVLNELIDDLEARVAGAPGDPEARMELADAYVTKLLTVPAGPERGVWGVKAEQQWKDVIDLDSNNWDAQFSLAENYSYYPEFLNKTGEAIAGLERARQIQEGLAAEPRHAKTYLLLSRLYSGDGDDASAREALESGLASHPGDKALLAALAELP